MERALLGWSSAMEGAACGASLLPSAAASTRGPSECHLQGQQGAGEVLKASLAKGRGKFLGAVVFFRNLNQILKLIDNKLTSIPQGELVLPMAAVNK